MSPFKSLKGWIKSQHKMLSTWRNLTFSSFGPADLNDALVQLGIKRGDVLFVHSSFDSFQGFSGKPTDVASTLQNLVGRQGAIMMPTMPFGGTATEYARKNSLVDLRRAPSKMGLLTELFRRSPGVVRSPHPTHPIAAWGDEAKQFAAGHHLARTPCGVPSPLHKLLERDGKIILLGTDIDVLTFYHTLEDILEQRLPVKPFTDEWFALEVRDEQGEVWQCNTRLYDPAVSRRRKLGALSAELRRMHAWRERRVGRLKIVVLNARDVLKACEHLLDRGIACYE